MDPLVIAGDETTPTVALNANTGILMMGGVAIPEDVRDISAPIIKWLNEYKKSPKLATEFIFQFDYLNTAASKMIFQVCSNLQDIHGKGNCKLKLVWKYTRGDIEMLELGEEVLENFNCITELKPIDQLL